MRLIKATSEREECRLLHAALADFSPNGARARYAGWLEAQGERGRAHAVYATVRAFQDLSLAPLEQLPGDADWQRMIAAPLLSVFVRATASYDRDEAKALRDLVFPRLRPALSMDYAPADSEPEIGASYLWGLPDMAAGEAWPKTSELSDWFRARAEIPQDLHCGFLGQIAFADMKGSILAEELPSTGGFAVFAIIEVDKLGIVEVLVRPWDNAAALTRRAAPADLAEDAYGQGVNAPQPFHVMDVREVLSLPDAKRGRFAAEIPGCGYDERHDRVYDLMRDACIAGADDGLMGFGGYLSATSGDDPSPDTSSLRFAVLRSSLDAGLVHLAIPAADLRAGRLDGVQYVWNDWDA
jgi:hypothetical protein